MRTLLKIARRSMSYIFWLTHHDAGSVCSCDLVSFSSSEGQSALRGGVMDSDIMKLLVIE